MGRGARNQRVCVCCEHVRNADVRPPSDSGPGVAGSGCCVSALCCAGREKIDRCRAPECAEPEVAGSGHSDSATSAAYEKKRCNYSMFQDFVKIFPLESFSF